MAILVTGGAGFIGSNFVLQWINEEGSNVINLDKLTYAGNLRNLSSLENNNNHTFVRGDIQDSQLVNTLLSEYKPVAVVHFAAESHVDRSIHDPEDFIKTNILGTFNLLETTRSYWVALPENEKNSFRFLNISTDEVYGSLNEADPPFTETTAYKPNSPYSASKAGADHLVRSYYHTFGLPTLTTNCSNNYGPFQFPEKLIPLILHNALSEKPLPVYGDGTNVRDWLHVEDHCRAIREVLKRGRVGETYNIGGLNEQTNLDVVTTICRLLDEYQPRQSGDKHENLIKFVEDRLGHDLRYAIDATKIDSELGWTPKESFESGIVKTVKWYLEHQQWVNDVTTGNYRSWIDKNYKIREKKE